VSETSPVTGDAPDPAAKAATGSGDGAAKPRARNSRTEIELEVSRSRSIGWTIFGVVFGALLVWKVGTVGVWVGYAMIATGLYHAFKLVQSLRHPPGTIIVSDREVSLPRGLCTPRPVVVTPHDVTAAYFLRRAVPWNHAAPVLVVELGPKAMLFPRDWFASEADQRHVIHALLRDKPDRVPDLRVDAAVEK
jgi:hypothetical protein